MGLSDANESYFQTCWLTLKAMRPRTAKLMDQIEIEVFGIKLTEKKPEKKKKNADNEQKSTVV
ncbi:hypothetical protein LCGC14_0844530 [marine sediment metagenome]|uniref:Uncharacterized protein n=1 Tax=marine sediment metagenome TaxID=412755 RepID=A0A0F9PGW3_9ZZZZ